MSSQVRTDLELFLLMRQLVLVEIGGVDERGGADGASVRLLAGVCPHVHHQIVLVLALVRAQVAEEVERV